MFTVLSLPNCMKCNLTKKKLDKSNVPYEVIDMTENEERAQWARAQGYVEAPVVIAPNGEHWSGYAVTRIEEHAAMLASA